MDRQCPAAKNVDKDQTFLTFLLNRDDGRNGDNEANVQAPKECRRRLREQTRLCTLSWRIAEVFFPESLHTATPVRSRSSQTGMQSTKNFYSRETFPIMRPSREQMLPATDMDRKSPALNVMAHLPASQL